MSQGRNDPYPMPEDPPEFGEDGLGYLNQPKAQFADDSGEKATIAVVEPSPADERSEEEDWADIVMRRRNPSNPFLKAFQKIIPYGGIFSSGINLASSTLGAGIVALPCAFQLTGIGMAITYLVVIGALTVYSISLLAHAGERTGLRSWSHVTRVLLGNGADYFLAFVMWFLCFGGDVSYIISLGAVFRAFLTNSPHTSEYFQSSSGVKVVTSIVWLIVILPLCLLREINSLRMVSFVAVFFLVLFVIAIMIDSISHLSNEGLPDDLVYFQTGNLAISGLALFMFAYIAQVNCYEIQREMYKPCVKRMTYSALCGVLVSGSLYFLAGLFGYLRFGGSITDSVLDKYNPIDDVLMGITYAGIVLKLSVGFALHLIPCRDAVFYVLKKDVRSVPFWFSGIVSGLQATLALIGGLFIPKITTVFGVLGGFCGGFIGFVFPALFMMYCGGFSREQSGNLNYFGTYFLLIVGIIGIVFGTGASIYGEISG